MERKAEVHEAVLLIIYIPHEQFRQDLVSGLFCGVHGEFKLIKLNYDGYC